MLAHASFGQGSGVKLPMLVVRRRFGTSTPDTIHRYLKTLLNRFEVPAIATILSIWCPLQACLRPRTRRRLSVPVPTCYVVMASPEHDIPHWPDFCVHASSHPSLCASTEQDSLQANFLMHMLRCLLGLRSHQYHNQQLLP